MPSITLAERGRVIWGLSLHGWEEVMRWSLASVGLFALIVGVATYFVVTLQREEIAESRARIEQLKSANLALQKILLPRRLAVVRMDEPFGGFRVRRPDLPDALPLFSELQKFPRTLAAIQAVPDFEAMNLALDLKAVLEQIGWRPELIDEKRSNLPPLRIPEGVTVLSFAPPSDDPADLIKSARWNEPAAALSQALIAAGVGSVGKYAFGASVIPNSPKNPPTAAYFDPPLEGVYVQIGMKPLSLEIMNLRSSGAGATPSSNQNQTK
jgi:hypothetical protein